APLLTPDRDWPTLHAAIRERIVGVGWTKGDHGVIWSILSLLAAPPPTCKTADPRVEAVIDAKLKETRGSEYCQARLYNTLDDLDGDGREDFVLVFTVEAAA